MRSAALLAWAWLLAACDPPTEAAPIEVTPGTHQAGDVFGDTFQTLATGDALPVVLGTQHAWMVVVAAELGALEPGVDAVGFICTLTAPNGRVLGTVGTERRPLSASGRYLLNIFLVVPDAVATGEWPARLELLVRANGAEGRAAVDLVLTGDG